MGWSGRVEGCSIGEGLQGLKPPILLVLSARLKPCPFTKPDLNEVCHQAGSRIQLRSKRLRAEACTVNLDPLGVIPFTRCAVCQTHRTEYLG